MKKGAKKNNLFSTNYVLIGFVTILVILFAFTYFNPVFSGNNFGLNSYYDQGELYAIGGNSEHEEDPCEERCHSQCKKCMYRLNNDGTSSFVGCYKEYLNKCDNNNCNGEKCDTQCSRCEIGPNFSPPYCKPYQNLPGDPGFANCNFCGASGICKNDGKCHVIEQVSKDYNCGEGKICYEGKCILDYFFV